MKYSVQLCSIILLGLAIACANHPAQLHDAVASQNAAGSVNNATSPGGDAGSDTAVPPANCVTQGNVFANIVVAADKGPHGVPQPVAITHALLSQNIYDQDRAQYVPHANNAYVAYLAALQPQFLRWPAGYYSQTYTFMPNGPEGQFNLTPALIAAFMELCQRVGAQPMITVNIATASPQNAAELVTYVNKTMGYNVRWWEIGNEPDVDGLSSTANPQAYAANYAAFAQAMKQADPSIKLVGGVLMTGEDILGQHASPDWLTPIVQSAGQAMDAVSWHYYPLFSSPNPDDNSSSQLNITDLLQEDAGDWPPAGLDFADSIMPYMRNLLAQYAPGAQIWITEFAEDPGYLAGAGCSDNVAGAIWAADALGRYADYGTEAIFKFIYRAEAEHKYTLLDEHDAPRPEYYTYWLYAQHFGDRMVAADSDQLWAVAAHAALNTRDGSLHVMLVNKRSEPHDVSLQLGAYQPRMATQYVLQGASMDTPQISLNGEQLDIGNIGKGAAAIAASHAEACISNILTLPANSVTLLIFSK